MESLLLTFTLAHKGATHMADAIPSNSGRIPEPQEKRDTRKPVRWRPEFGLDHPDAPMTPKEALKNRKADKKAAKKAAKQTSDA